AVPFPNFGAAAFGEHMLLVYMQAGQALITNAIAFNQEMMRFAAERMQADAQGLHDVMQCKNWQDAMVCQSQFLDSATRAY
ncbi:hypothetical protein GN156_37005, partial [bacterium LRH843]|nr:hypothetical protein [bacterium LRH843]